MATVALPGAVPPTREGVGVLGARVAAAGYEAAFTTVAGRVWLRLSAQAYNEAGDYEGLAGVLQEAIAAGEGAG